MVTVPRNTRNNNPGNIRHSSDVWRGMSKEQTDDDFVQYETPHFGIRASARNFRTYFRTHGNDTITKLITSGHLLLRKTKLAIFFLINRERRLGQTTQRLT